jgi:hypothetical protein
MSNFVEIFFSFASKTPLDTGLMRYHKCRIAQYKKELLFIDYNSATDKATGIVTSSLMPVTISVDEDQLELKSGSADNSLYTRRMTFYFPISTETIVFSVDRI